MSHDILAHFKVPNAYLHVLENTKKPIKLKEVKAFLGQAHIKPSYACQIFIIENFSKLTTSAANSLLKLLEEPAPGNIIFLTNTGENNILETILSRVQIIHVGTTVATKTDDFFQNLIHTYSTGDSQELIAYFFRNKLEKEEYVQFLYNVVHYAKKHMILISLLPELLDDITLIQNNNLSPKYIADKWILQLR